MVSVPKQGHILDLNLDKAYGPVSMEKLFFCFARLNKESGYLVIQRMHPKMCISHILFGKLILC